MVTLLLLGSWRGVEFGNFKTVVGKLGGGVVKSGESSNSYIRRVQFRFFRGCSFLGDPFM